jgi:hypothetical protein
LKTSDKINIFLSSIAIVISVAVWLTSDTRISELRDKKIQYAVEDWITADKTAPSLDADDNVIPPQEAPDVSEIAVVTVRNVGKLAVKDVTVSIGTTGEMPPPVVQITPVTPIYQQINGNMLSITLKNAMEPQSIVGIRIEFPLKKDKKILVKKFAVNEASVDSEVGGAIPVPVIITKHGSSWGEQGKPRVAIDHKEKN